ncbi:MAG: hypothetical protein K2K75_10780, partial [Muribaculaceae bacterium]|nr:hypothetical protein [Muribaculaceae bacterium]
MFDAVGRARSALATKLDGEGEAGKPPSQRVEARGVRPIVDVHSETGYGIEYLKIQWIIFDFGATRMALGFALAGEPPMVVDGARIPQVKNLGLTIRGIPLRGNIW